MKLTGLFIAAGALLFSSACSQKSEEVVDTTEKSAATTEMVTDVAEDVMVAADAFAAGVLVDPNTAGADAIAAVPGIDAKLAEQIIAGRPYATPSGLHAVLKDSVAESTLKTIYSIMFVKVDLNTGSSADYRLIPSTLSPGHLAHEFEEYRPYSSMEQFSREMSKYVSAEEVVFLQRYVFIN